MKKVAVIMGSDSDLKIASKAAEVLDSFNIPFEVRVLSAHRTPEETASYAEGLEAAGFGAVIAFAGMAAHLAGAIAAKTLLPVIGVPVASSLGGADALLATVQMPSGIPVATVAVDGGKNAAFLAAQIIATSDDELRKALAAQRKEAAKAVLEKDDKIRAQFHR